MERSRSRRRAFIQTLGLGLLAACGPQGAPAAAGPSQPGPTVRPAVAPVASASPSASPVAQVVGQPSPVPALPTAAPVELAATGVGPTVGGTLFWAPGGEPETLDPANVVTAVGEAVAWPLFDGLVSLSPTTFEPYPALAEYWETSPDGLRYTFRLRQGVRFHDGSLLDAETARYSLARLLGSESARQSGLLQGLVREVRALDRLTLQVELERPFGPFVHHLGQLGATMISPAAHGATGSDFGRQPVGSGPFRLALWEPGSRLVLERWDECWRGAANLARVVVRFEAASDGRLDLLTSGRVDLLGPIGFDQAERLRQRPGLQVDYASSARALGISINTRFEALADRRVRQALEYAVDRAALAASVYDGQAVPLGGPLGAVAGVGPPMPPLPYAPERARQLLSAAGYASGLDLVLAGPQGRQPRDQALLRAVHQQLSAIGLRLRLDPLAGASYTAEATRPVEESQLRLLLVGWLPRSGEAHGGLFPLFHSSQAVPRGFNTSFFQNQTFDRLLEQALRTADPSQRVSLYRQALLLLREEAPWIYLLAPRLPLAGSARLHGLTVTVGELVTIGEQTWLE